MVKVMRWIEILVIAGLWFCFLDDLLPTWFALVSIAVVFAGALPLNRHLAARDRERRWKREEQERRDEKRQREKNILFAERYGRSSPHIIESFRPGVREPSAPHALPAPVSTGSSFDVTELLTPVAVETAVEAAVDAGATPPDAPGGDYSGGGGSFDGGGSSGDF